MFMLRLARAPAGTKKEIGIMAHIVVRLVDYDGEKSTVKYPIPDLTAGNIAATIADAGTLVAALQAITKCVVLSWYITTEDTLLSAVERSPNTDANREAAWLHRFTDSVNFDKFTLTTPGPDDAMKDTSNRKYALLTEVSIAAYKTAFEAVVQPGANSVVIGSLEWVGRNT